MTPVRQRAHLMRMQIGDAMAKLIMFKSPEVAERLRSSGFSIFKQNLGKDQYFAVEDTPASHQALMSMKAQFDLSNIKIADKLYF